MQCDNFEPRLQELLDAYPAPPFDGVLNDPVLSGHAAECAACRQLLAAMVAIVGEEAAAQVSACSPAVAGRVLEQMQPRLRRRVFSLRLAVPLAAAASLAVALTMWSWLAGGRSPQAEQLAQSTTLPQPPVPAIADFNGLDQNLDLNLDLGLTGFSDDVREGLAPVTRSTAGTSTIALAGHFPRRGQPHMIGLPGRLARCRTAFIGLLCTLPCAAIAGGGNRKPLAAGPRHGRPVHRNSRFVRHGAAISKRQTDGRPPKIRHFPPAWRLKLSCARASQCARGTIGCLGRSDLCIV